MSLNAFNEDSTLLRLDLYIARAVHRRGLVAVLRAAAIAWVNQRRIPADMPARLRADMGLPPKQPFWPEISDNLAPPFAMWRPG